MGENFFAYIMVGVTVVWLAGLLVWFFRRQYGPSKTVRGTVVGKQVTEAFSRYSAKKEKHYYVTFLINGKHRSFEVSRFSYGSYQKGQTGTLEHKGDRLIDFH